MSENKYTYSVSMIESTVTYEKIPDDDFLVIKKSRDGEIVGIKIFPKSTFDIDHVYERMNYRHIYKVGDHYAYNGQFFDMHKLISDEYNVKYNYDEKLPAAKIELFTLSEGGIMYFKRRNYTTTFTTQSEVERYLVPITETQKILQNIKR